MFLSNLGWIGYAQGYGSGFHHVSGFVSGFGIRIWIQEGKNEEEISRFDVLDVLLGG